MSSSMLRSRTTSSPSKGSHTKSTGDDDDDDNRGGGPFIRELPSFRSRTISRAIASAMLPPYHSKQQQEEEEEEGQEDPRTTRRSLMMNDRLPTDSSSQRKGHSSENPCLGIFWLITIANFLVVLLSPRSALHVTPHRLQQQQQQVPKVTTLSSSSSSSSTTRAGSATATATVQDNNTPNQQQQQQQQSKLLWKVPTPIIAMGFAPAGAPQLYEYFQCAVLAKEEELGPNHNHHEGDDVLVQNYCCCQEIHKTARQGCPTANMANCIRRNVEGGSSSSSTTTTATAVNDVVVVRKAFDGCGVTEHAIITQLEAYLEDPVYLPQVYALDAIYHSFPNATWLLNYDPDWSHHVQGHDFVGDRRAWRYVHAFPDQPVPRGNKNGFLHQLLVQHLERIRTYVMTHPSLTLVELSLDQAATILSDQVGGPVSCWRKED